MLASTMAQNLIDGHGCIRASHVPPIDAPVAKDGPHDMRKLRPGQNWWNLMRQAVPVGHR